MRTWLRSLSLDRVGFLASALVLVFFYGFVARSSGWFPAGMIDRAARQAQRILSPPLYLVPRVHERDGARIVRAEAMQPGLTLVSTRWEGIDWQPGLRLMNREGDVLHEWHVDPTELLTSPDMSDAAGSIREVSERPLHGSYLFPDGDVVVNVAYLGTVRLDACSRIEWIVSAGNHHSIARADDGSFWIPGNTYGVRSSTPSRPEGFPGLGQPVYLDRILRVSPGGDVLDSLDVLDLLYENGLERHIFKAGRTTITDVTHLNDIEPLSASLSGDFPGFDAGDLLVSLRHLDLVFVVDPESRRVKWHASHPFIEQHDPDFLPGGWIGVFDNNRDATLRGTVLGGSRIVAVKPGSDSVRVLFPTELSQPFHTDIMGKWQQLSNGNLLLTEARAGRIVEVSPEGETVWEWVSPPYDSSFVPEVPEGTRYPLTRDSVADWPCHP